MGDQLLSAGCRRSCTTRLEHSPELEELSVNHLEGRTAAFFCYGDGGGDELDDTGWS